MIKYVPEDTSIVFSEIPDEIAMALNISQCPRSCVGCHSPYLQADTGEELTAEILGCLIKENHGITCVSFMGEGRDKETLLSLAQTVRKDYGLKTALYSGRSEVPEDYDAYFDYIKVGPYIEACGPLNKTTTNQVLYQILPDGTRLDITFKFWRSLDGKAKYELNPDLEHVKMVRKGQERNKAKYGEKYCPCKIEHTPDTICPCLEYRETGECHCKLFKR